MVLLIKLISYAFQLSLISNLDPIHSYFGKDIAWNRTTNESNECHTAFWNDELGVWWSNIEI